MLLSLALAAVPQGAAPPPAVTLQVQYDPGKQLGEPGYDETLANIVYPVAKGPLSQGYPVQPLPVIVFFRGGNTNNILPGTPTVESFTDVPEAAKDIGFVGVDCNSAIIGVGEDMEVTVASLRLLIQYLRHHGGELNIDPGRVFVHGRSAGTLMAYAVALKEDAQDLSSPEPQHHWPSRPQYMIPRYGPSSATCFASGFGPWSSAMGMFLFPDKAFDEATPTELLHASPTWWLVNPHLYGRTVTPPMCVVSYGPHTDVCGQVDDVHSGLMGDLIWRAAQDFAEVTGRPDYLERCIQIDSSQHPDPIPPTLGWALLRLADDYDGLYLPPPSGVVGPSGGELQLYATGCTPGGTVTFYTGLQEQPAPLGQCPGAELAIANPTVLGSGVATASGLASVTFFVPASSVGTTVLFQAADAANCEVSNVDVHRYY